MKTEYHRFTLTSSGGEALFCDARLPIGMESPLPAVIFVHGFKGFKDWGSHPYVCDALARLGFYVLSFNFSHNGVDGHSHDFTRLDRFELNTCSLEVRELIDVIDAVGELRVQDFEHVAPEQIGLLGHSRGGGISLLAGEMDDRVRAIATWAPVSTLDRFTDEQKARWRMDGNFASKNARTGQDMRLGIGLLTDLEENAEELNVEDAARRFGRPLLIVHGEQDLSVRPEEGQRLYDLADRSLTEIEMIPSTGHTFGAIHPFAGTTPALERAIKRTAVFLGRHLRV